MARIEPFEAWRPRPDLVARVASPPYDVLSTDEARELAKGNPYSFLHVIKPEIDLPPGTDPYSNQVYEKAAENFRKLIEDGVMIREEKPAFYVYRLKMGSHVQTGIVAGASVEEYDSGKIKKHEHTRKAKEDDRTRHIETVGANTGPVFLAYRANPEVDSVIEGFTKGDPVYDFVAEDGIQHTLWVVKNPDDVYAIKNAFSKVPHMYVADGHHRSAAASRLAAKRRAANPNHTGDEPYNFFLAVIFPHDQLQILDYNRVVRDLAGMSPEEFISKVAEKFDVVEYPQNPKPSKPHEFGMYLGGRWYRLKAQEGSFDPGDPVESLDVAVLQNNLLKPVLGIEDPRKDERIDFVGGIRGLEELERRVDSGKWAVAFALYPTSIEQLFAVADAGLVMPPKSTWFEPKLRSGLVVRPLD